MSFATPSSVSQKKSIQEIAQDRERYRALDRHRAAMFVLTQKDRPIPSLQEMKDDLAKDEIVSIKERISTAKADHKCNLERIYAAHAEDYLEDQRLRRESREDYTGGQLDGSNRLAEWSEKRDPLTSTDHHYKAALCSALTTEHIRHITVIHALELKRRELELHAEEERRRQDAAFPLSLAEFKSKPRDIQIRIATFLSADNMKKEKMINEFGWAWRQTQALIREYDMNAEFKSDIQKLLETLESKDPRRKPTQ